MNNIHWISSDNTLLIICVISCLIICLFVLINHLCIKNNLLSKNYYTVDEICPELINIYENLDAINKEVLNVQNKQWVDWPEKNLYDGQDKGIVQRIFKKSNNDFKWNIYPFTAFGIEVTENCESCPELWKFLKQIPGLKVALLSRLGPGTKLNSHRGWANLSNHVIRCHFGFKVPKGCYVSVKESENADEEFKYQKEHKWICFDDSKYHYAHNPTSEDRIVLIVDIQRPQTIKTGDSDIGDTKELLQLLDYFKHKNIHTSL